MLHMSVVRSPYPHARITAIDVSAAAASPGCARCTPRRTSGRARRRHPRRPGLRARQEAGSRPVPDRGEGGLLPGRARGGGARHRPLPRRRRRPARQRRVRPAPAVIDLDAAIEPGSPTAHEGAPDNVAWDAVFPAATSRRRWRRVDVRLTQRITESGCCRRRWSRAAASPTGCPSNRVTLWSSTRAPHFLRLFISGFWISGYFGPVEDNGVKSSSRTAMVERRYGRGPGFHRERWHLHRP